MTTRESMKQIIDEYDESVAYKTVNDERLRDSVSKVNALRKMDSLVIRHPTQNCDVGENAGVIAAILPCEDGIVREPQATQDVIASANDHVRTDKTIQSVQSMSVFAALEGVVPLDDEETYGAAQSETTAKKASRRRSPRKRKSTRGSFGHSVAMTNGDHEQRADEATLTNSESEFVTRIQVMLFRCNFCNLCFTSLAEMRKHLDDEPIHRLPKPACANKMSLLKKLECDDCGASFIYESEFLRHRDSMHSAHKQNSSIALTKCAYCDEILRPESHVVGHFIHKHNGVEFKTEQCNESHKCTLCGKELASLNTWLVHVQTHNVSKSFECAICHEKYQLQAAFLEHVLRHPADRPYSCDDCPETFGLLVSRETHRKRHGRFRCKLCSNIYMHQKSLLKHMKKMHPAYVKDDLDDGKTEENIKHEDETNEVDAEKEEDDMTETNAEDDDEDVYEPPTTRSPKAFGRMVTRRKKRDVLKSEPEAENDFQCDLCDLKFSTRGARRDHFAKDHTGKMRCAECDITFNHRRGLRRHRIRCHGPKTKSWVCEVCGKAFDCTYALSTHRRTHFAEKKHACSVCGMKFQRPENMRRHEMRHGGNKAFMCDICGARYTTKFILLKHVESHIDPKDKVFLCDTCGEGFSRPNILKWHITSECGKRAASDRARPSGVATRGRTPGVQNINCRQFLPFPCTMCRKGFKEKDILDRHIKSFHTNDEALICDDCGIRFRTLATLTTHRAIHSGQLKHKCRFCDKEFLRETLKQIHEREKHTGEKPFQCKYCEESFTRKGKLRAHQLIHFGKEIKCDYCDMIFAKLDTKMKHMKKHTNERPYGCNVCGKAFKEKYNLEIHMRTHSNQKAFSCKSCGKRYSEVSGLKNHMKSHESPVRMEEEVRMEQVEVTTYACDICGHLFLSAEALVSHTQRLHTMEVMQPHELTELRPESEMTYVDLPRIDAHGELPRSQVQILPVHTLEELSRPPSHMDMQEHRPQSREIVQQHVIMEQMQQRPITTMEQLQRPQTYTLVDALQRPQNYSLETLQRSQPFTMEQLQRQTQNFTVETLQRPQFHLMEQAQRPPLPWNLNP